MSESLLQRQRIKNPSNIFRKLTSQFQCAHIFYSLNTTGFELCISWRRIIFQLKFLHLVQYRKSNDENDGRTNRKLKFKMKHVIANLVFPCRRLIPLPQMSINWIKNKWNKREHSIKLSVCANWAAGRGVNGTGVCPKRARVIPVWLYGFESQNTLGHLNAHTTLPVTISRCP